MPDFSTQPPPRSAEGSTTIATTEIYLPSIQEIEQEMANIINQRVVNHLEAILKQVAQDHLINYQQLKTHYLDPISEVAKELKK